MPRLAVRCDARRVIGSPISRQRRAYTIVAGVMRFVYAALTRRLSARFSAMRQYYSELHFHHYRSPILRHDAATTSPPPGGRRLNCFWLIYAPDATRLAASSAPTARRQHGCGSRWPESPVRRVLNASARTGVCIAPCTSPLSGLLCFV